MNAARIQQALNDIKEYGAALAWLEEYGKGIDGRDRDAATVSVTLYRASACPGAPEAAKTLGAYARLSLPALVETSIQSCRNTIEMAKSAIREEAARDAGASDG